MNDQQRATMQMALDLLEMDEKYPKRIRGSYPKEVITALREALAQPQDHSDKQDPIAYLFTDIQSGDTEASCDPKYKQSATWIREPLCLILQDSPQPQGEWVDLLAAFESVWLWMENQADGQSKGGHATFDLMMLREQRDIAHAAISKFKSKNFPPVVPQSEPVAWQKRVDDVCYKATEIRFAKSDEKAQTVIDEIRALLETAPQTAALAAKAMRDKAVEVCFTTGEDDPLVIRQRIADNIAALPVPEIVWNDLTGAEVLTVARDIEGDYTVPLYTTPPSVEAWIDPNDKTQARYLPHIGEPVAVISESAIGLVKLHSNGACLPFGTQLYAAPVSAEPCKECDAKQAKIDSLMLEYCPDEITDEQMAEWSANQKPVSECRHCGWLCMPNDSHSKKWYPMQEPVKQEPVAWATKISKAFFNSPANGVFQVSHLMRDEYSVPLYTTPPSVGAARIADSESWMQVIDAEVANAIEATKEKAAKVFHEQAELFQIDYYVAQTIVEVIRSMK